MVDRLLVAAILVVVGALVFWAFSLFQRRRAEVAVQRERAQQRIRDQSSASDGPEARTDEAREGEPRVLYFRSEHCTSCRTQARLWEDLEPSVRRLIEKVDVDRQAERAAAYNVMTLPTTVVMDAEGNVQHINYGIVPAKKLYRQLAQG